MKDKKLEKVIALMREMDLDQLNSASKFLNAIWKDKHKTKAIMKSTEFMVGDIVEFNSRKGGVVRGELRRKSAKTGSVYPDANSVRYYTVPWTMLRKVA